MASPHGLTPGWALALDRALGVPADSRCARMATTSPVVPAGSRWSKFFRRDDSLATPLFNTTGCVES